MRRIRTSKAGFTLIELIISMAVLLIVSIPLTGYFITSSQNNQRADLHLEANQLAQRFMEEWKQRGAVDLTAEGIPIPIVDIENAAGTLIVKRTAVAVDNQIELDASVTEPPVPVSPGLGAEVDRNGLLNPQQVISRPVASAIENYQENSGDLETTLGDDLQACFVLEDTGVRDSNTPGDLPVPANEIVVRQAGALVEVVYGTTVRHPLTNGQASLMFLVNEETPPNIRVLGSPVPMSIYMVQGQNAESVAFPEATVNLDAGVTNVQIIRNLVKASTEIDEHRLYRIEVQVREKGKPAEQAMVTVSSYMRTK